MFGTFFLVFVGTGAIVINDVSNGAITHLSIALTFGLVVLSLIYACKTQPRRKNSAGRKRNIATINDPIGPLICRGTRSGFTFFPRRQEL